MARFTPEQFRAAMEKAPVAVFQAVSQSLISSARTFVQGTFVRNRLSGRPGLQTGGGDLRRSFNLAHTGNDLRSFRLVEFTTSPSAVLHEKGGVVRPRKSKYLAIPLGEAKTAAGVARASVRSYKDTFVRPSPRRSALVVYQRRGSRSVALFLLLRSVTIPARLGFEAEWRTDQPGRMDRVGDVVHRVLANMK